ncbi:MAG: EAL domain-containing protein [Eubacterium sp.]|nr:EAL domain-containing protein [Eubacterium sp.]
MENSRDRLVNSFSDNMRGGAVIYRASENCELLYANTDMVRLFECDDYDDFMEYTGGNFKGVVNGTQYSHVQNEIDIRLSETDSNFGYNFFNIRTQKGNVRHVVNHWTLVNDEQEGRIFYCNLYLRHLHATVSETDLITGLNGRTLFNNYVIGINNKDYETDKDSYAIVYINIVHFKLLNINRGVNEGDRCLKVLADILNQTYEDAYISRISDDHFAVFAKFDGIKVKTDKANVIFRDTYGSRYNVNCKFGIYKFKLAKNLNIETAMSLAKVACDYIKHDPKKDVVVYSEKFAQEVNATEYVIRKIDEAIEKDWIKIYYQPVIRSLTGQLCGMESLVRWEDPNIGFLMPDRFITVLEKEQCIHKLDSYVVEKVCQCLHDRVQNNEPIVPVSVNFSRLDFIMCDMLDVVEAAVEKYDVPRDYIHIEITESMIAKDEELMRDVIHNFREAGYEIWMDDFGSGYSSLTLLKDYKFDMLKLDMRFLNPFTEKSKNIVRATVQMAKDIGIKTLAEGVETQEHLDFLKDIGCERIQGYYYGKPEPIEDMFRHLEEKNVSIERRKWRHFYEVASFNVRATDAPLEVIEDDGENFRTLFMNKPYMEQIFGEVKPDLEEVDRIIYKTNSPLLRKYREFANAVEKSGKTETFYYTENGNILQLTAKEISKSYGHHILKCSLVNITLDKLSDETERMNAKLKEINQLFDGVHVFDLKNNRIVPLVGEGYKYIDKTKLETDNLDEVLDLFIRESVFPLDMDWCRVFLDTSTLKERIESSEKGYITTIFRIKDSTGNYIWRENYIMMIPGTNGREYLSCVKPYEFVISSFKENAMCNDPVYANLWDNFIWYSKIKAFWKDKNRRFIGVSRAFLDYYGIKSMNEIVGKNDEDMHWHLDNDPYRNDELDVLNKGIKVENAIGQCIVKGVVHTIICNKMPYYENGEIAGLVGYFEDVDEMLNSVGKKIEFAKIDTVTGLMNARTFVDSMIDYAIQYNNKGHNYGLILLKNKKHGRIEETYGEDFANTVLKTMGERIIEVTGQTCVVARARESIFAILTFVDSADELEKLAREIGENLRGLNEVDGNSVTLRVDMVTTLRTDEGITDENMYGEALGKMDAI